MRSTMGRNDIIYNLNPIKGIRAEYIWHLSPRWLSQYQCGDVCHCGHLSPVVESCRYGDFSTGDQPTGVRYRLQRTGMAMFSCGPVPENREVSLAPDSDTSLVPGCGPPAAGWLRSNSCSALDRTASDRPSAGGLGVARPEHGELQMLGGFSRGRGEVLERRHHMATLGRVDRSQGLFNGLAAPVGDGLHNLSAAIGQA